MQREVLEAPSDPANRVEAVWDVQEISSLSTTADGRALGVEFSGVLYNGETIRVEVNTGG